MNYFKKSVPATPIWLGSGRKLIFPTVDGITGYFATENPELAGILREAARNHRGGTSEIAAPEYEAWTKKKANSPPYKRQSRFSEGMRAATPPDTIGRSVAAKPVAAIAVKPAIESPPPAPPATAPGEAKPIIKPKVGRPRKHPRPE